MRTSELIGPALDWAVAKCENHEIESLRGGAVWYWLKCSLTGTLEVVEVFNPSTDWAQGGPIIEREKIDVRWNLPKTECFGHISTNPHTPFEPSGLYSIYRHGPTPLIAAMRCYVASKLGDEVEIPEDLR